ncbi:MAG: DUF1698 domain-containing protein [Fibrobacteres bacterium]|nr:DUF1698 domain-containing protein [Fibrobacterota bacterium]
MNRDEKAKMINNVGYWWHSIDCGDGLVTPGFKTIDILNNEWKSIGINNLTGRTVLDIGAWDGYFSFKAEECGAKRVCALDHYVWSLDLEFGNKIRKDILEGRRVMPQEPIRMPSIWNPGMLPGKKGFDTAHTLRNSKVEQYVADFMKMDLVELGTWDVVFFLGVLYHLQNPLEGLKRLALITRELAVIETQGIYINSLEQKGLFEFYEADELNNDSSNWFAPNLLGLQKACRAAGFREVQVSSPYPPDGAAYAGNNLLPCRLTVHAYK